MVTLKYGKRLESLFKEPGGRAIKAWLNDCDNNVYCALTYMGGKGRCKVPACVDVDIESGYGVVAMEFVSICGRPTGSVCAV